MKRRTLVLCLGCTAFRGALARPEVADTLSRPMFLHGPVNVISWADPHPHLELFHRAGARDALARWQRMASRPGGSPAIERMVADAIVPPTDEGSRWRVELPALARLSVGDVPRLKVGEILDVLGFWRSPHLGTPTIGAELLLIGDSIQALPPLGSRA